MVLRHRDILHLDHGCCVSEYRNIEFLHHQNADSNKVAGQEGIKIAPRWWSNNSVSFLTPRNSLVGEGRIEVHRTAARTSCPTPLSPFANSSVVTSRYRGVTRCSFYGFATQLAARMHRSRNDGPEHQTTNVHSLIRGRSRPR